MLEGGEEWPQCAVAIPARMHAELKLNMANSRRFRSSKRTFQRELRVLVRHQNHEILHAEDSAQNSRSTEKAEVWLPPFPFSQSGMAVAGNNIGRTLCILGKAEHVAGFQHVQCDRAVRGKQDLASVNGRQGLQNRLDGARMNAVLRFLDQECPVNIRWFGSFSGVRCRRTMTAA